MQCRSLSGRGRLGDPFPAEAWAEWFAVNVTVVLPTVQALRPNPGKGARTAIISSGMAPARRLREPATSTASKAAATNLARNLAAELRSEGVAVGACHSGRVRTEMGGADGDLDVHESAAGLLARLDALSLDTRGVFVAWDGPPLPF